MTTARRALPRWSQQWWIWFSAIAWMLLTILQAWLIKSGWRRYHRTVGYFSLSLAVDGLHRHYPTRSCVGADLYLWDAKSCA